MPSYKLRKTCYLIGIASLFMATNANAVELKQFEGLWAISSDDCQDPDGPNYKTYISATEVDQYENHCRISNVKPVGDSLILSLFCDREGELERSSLKLSSVANGRILLKQDDREEKIYERCNYKTPEESKTDNINPLGPGGISCSDPDILNLVSNVAKQSDRAIFRKPTKLSTGITLQLIPVIKYEGITTIKPTNNNRGFYCTGVAMVSYDDPLSQQTYNFLKKSRSKSDQKFSKEVTTKIGEQIWKWTIMLSDDGKNVLVEME